MTIGRSQEKVIRYYTALNGKSPLVQWLGGIRDDVVVVLLCGGDKASQWKDVDLAKRYWKELQEREL